MEPSFKKAGHKRLKRRKKINYGGLVILSVWLLFAAGFANIYNKSYRPVLETAAKYRAERILGEAVNSVYAKVISESEITYGDIIKTETGPDGNIVSAKADLILLGNIKSRVITLLNEKINSRSKTDIYIPLGNLLGSDIFSGMGPMIKTSLIASGSAEAGFENSFSYSGINQTRQVISIKITARLAYLLPGALSDEISLTEEFPVAESIIAGKVPDALTDLETELGAVRDDILNLQ